MVAVANITEISNSVTVSDVLAALMAPALVKKTCMVNLMYTENLPVKTMVKKFGKKGTLTAAIIAESVAQAVNSSGELTDSSISATMAKCAVVSGLSVEDQTFGNISLDRIAEEQGKAIGRYVDNDGLSMFTGFSTVVTAASLLTIDDVMLAQFNIFNSECPDKEIPLAVVLSHRGHYNIKKEINQTGAAAYTNTQFLDILMSTPQANCFAGSLPGFDFYATSGHSTSGANTAQGVFHPKWALAGAFAESPIAWTQNRGAEGFYTEVASYYFYDIIEWNDLAGVELLSAT